MATQRAVNLCNLLVNASFDFQVWEEHYSGLFPWLWTCEVASAGRLGTGLRWGCTLRNAATARRCAPAHQSGIRLSRWLPLLPLQDIRQKGQHPSDNEHFSSWSHDRGNNSDLKSTSTQSEGSVYTAVISSHRALQHLHYCVAHCHSQLLELTTLDCVYVWKRTWNTENEKPGHYVKLVLKGINKVPDNGINTSVLFLQFYI